MGEARTPDGGARSLVVVTSGPLAAAAARAMARMERSGSAPQRVVTATARAAAALAVPHLSLSELARTVLAERGVAVAPPTVRRAALEAAVAAAWAARDPAGTARAVEPTVSELLVAGAVQRGPAAVDDGSRLGRLLGLVAEYVTALHRAGVIDPDEVLWRAADSVGTGTRLLVAGHTALSAAEGAFLMAHAAPGSVVLVRGTPAGSHPDEPVFAALLEAGWVLEHDRASASPGTPRVTGGRLETIDDECRHALTTIKALLASGVHGDDIALCAPDPRVYGPTLAAVAREYGVDVRCEYRVPLSASPVGNLVVALAGVVAAGLPYEETARLLAHHLVAPLDADAWHQARLYLPDTRVAWSRYDDRVAALDWPRMATRQAYLEALLAALEALGVRQRLADDARGTEQLLLVEAALGAHAAARSGAAAVPGRRLDEEADRPISRATYASELKEQLLLATTVPDVTARVGAASEPGGARDRVRLHAMTALAGARVPHVFLVGTADGAVPRRLDPGAWLDFGDRRAARAAGLLVDGAAELAQREALRFAAVVDAASETLTLTYAVHADRDGRLPSPYAAALGVVDEALPAGDRKQPASREELRRLLVARGVDRPDADDPTMVHVRHALAVESRRESGAPPDAHDGVIGEPYDVAGGSFSATSLLALGQCPFKWFAGYLLDLREPEEAEAELSARVRGDLYHKTLDLACAAVAVPDGVAAEDSERQREAILEALPDAFARAERDEAARTSNWELYRERHLEVLRRAVRSASFLPSGAVVVRTEARFGASGGAPVEWRGFPVSGRVDRVDVRAEGLTLVDYKTSSSPPVGAVNDAGDAKVDLQLPIYLEAALPALGLTGSGGPPSAEYYSLTKARTIRSLTRGDAGRADDTAVQSVAARARANLEQGSYPVAPDRQRTVCTYCSFDLVCRVGPRVERKRAGDG